MIKVISYTVKAGTFEGRKEAYSTIAEAKADIAKQHDITNVNKIELHYSCVKKG